MTETTEGKTAFPKVSAAPSSHCRFWLTITVILVSDQLSKWVIVDLSGFKRGLYPPFGGVELIPGFFNLVYAVNYGAAWGMLEGYSWLLVALAVLVLVLIGVFRKDLAYA
jgi:lipoprotein signal peptidase